MYRECTESQLVSLQSFVVNLKGWSNKAIVLKRELLYEEL